MVQFASIHAAVSCENLVDVHWQVVFVRLHPAAGSVWSTQLSWLLSIIFNLRRVWGTYSALRDCWRWKLSKNWNGEANEEGNIEVLHGERFWRPLRGLLDASCMNWGLQEINYIDITAVLDRVMVFDSVLPYG